jgi:hypothetical protein
VPQQCIIACWLRQWGGLLPPIPCRVSRSPFERPPSSRGTHSILARRKKCHVGFGTVAVHVYSFRVPGGRLVAWNQGGTSRSILAPMRPGEFETEPSSFEKREWSQVQHVDGQEGPKPAIEPDNKLIDDVIAYSARLALRATAMARLAVMRHSTRPRRDQRNRIHHGRRRLVLRSKGTNGCGQLHCLSTRGSPRWVGANECTAVSRAEGVGPHVVDVRACEPGSLQPPSLRLIIPLELFC